MRWSSRRPALQLGANHELGGRTVKELTHADYHICADVSLRLAETDAAHVARQGWQCDRDGAGDWP